MRSTNKIIQFPTSNSFGSAAPSGVSQASVILLLNCKGNEVAKMTFSVFGKHEEKIDILVNHNEFSLEHKITEVYPLTRLLEVVKVELGVESIQTILTMQSNFIPQNIQNHIDSPLNFVLDDLCILNGLPVGSVSIHRWCKLYNIEMLLGVTIVKQTDDIAGKLLIPLINKIKLDALSLSSVHETHPITSVHFLTVFFLDEMLVADMLRDPERYKVQMSVYEILTLDETCPAREVPTVLYELIGSGIQLGEILQSVTKASKNEFVKNRRNSILKDLGLDPV